MSSSDIKAKRVTSTGSLSVGPARIRGLHVLVGGGAGRLTVTDGSGGETVLDLDFAQSDTDSVTIPDYGIRLCVRWRYSYLYDSLILLR